MEEKKDDKPAFSKISRAKIAAAGGVPAAAMAEWGCVHSADDARKWHTKWTPWFTAEQIEGIVKYAYEDQLIPKK